MLGTIEIELFLHRTGDGSEKEYSIYEQLLDSTYSCGEALRIEVFDGRNCMRELEFIVKGIKDLQSRKFVKFNLKFFSNYHK